MERNLPPTAPIFVGNVRIVVEGGVVRLVGYQAPGALIPESREISQMVMSDETFRQLLADGRRKLARNSH